MKHFLTTFALALGFSLVANAQNNLGINNPTPDASAVLDVKSTTQGMLVPRMTQSQRNSIPTVNGVSAPATGLLVYQTDNTPGFYYYNGTAWVAFGGSTYPNVELNIVNNSSQNISALAGTASTVPLAFSGTNNSNAALTGSNTWNGTTFTVGATGAGWYEFTVHVKGVTSTGGETNIGTAYFMDINGAGTPGSFISTYDLQSSAQPIAIRNSSKINGVQYLAAGTTIQFKAQSWSTTTGSYTSADGSTSLTIVRLK